MEKKVRKYRKKPVVIKAYQTDEELMIARDTYNIGVK